MGDGRLVPTEDLPSPIECAVGHFFDVRLSANLCKVILGPADEGKARKSGGIRAITKLSRFLELMRQHMKEYDPGTRNWSKDATGVEVTSEWCHCHLRGVQTPPLDMFPELRQQVQDSGNGFRIFMVELTWNYMVQTKKFQWNLAGHTVTEKDEYCRVLETFLSGIRQEKMRQYYLTNRKVITMSVPWDLQCWTDMPIILWVAPKDFKNAGRGRGSKGEGAVKDTKGKDTWGKQSWDWGEGWQWA